MYKKLKKRIPMMMLMIGCLIFSFAVMKVTTVSAKKDYPYYIKVNKQQNCITVYEKDKNGKYTVPVKAMTCSTGWATPLGTYNTIEKYRWKLLMGDVWGQYSTRIVKGILFHSVWYYKMDPSTLSATQYNKLGSTASHGCIRITVEDAKWIYDNCPVGTTVEIYNDKDPGPLGKPETIKLKAGTGWDPTDTNKDNPFNNKTPNINGAKNRTIEWGTEIDLLKGVTATSTTGMDITSKIKVEGKVDSFTAGKYKIIYYATDAIGRMSKKGVTVTVKEGSYEPVFTGITDRYVTSDMIVDRDFALEGVSASVRRKAISNDNIEVEIIKDTEETYTIVYSATKNGYNTTETSTVYIDDEAPEISGIDHKEITLKELQSGSKGIKKLAAENLSVSDNLSKLTIKDVVINVKTISDYGYYVSYHVKDKAGNKTSITVQFTYFSDAKIKGVTNREVPSETKITKEFVMEGVTASNKAGDCTSQVEIQIDDMKNGKYKVEYLAPNTDGSYISVISYFTVKEGSL
ncbi:MAG: DUF5011 domain-containing protein [Anaerocolumna aminovalerica]|uniref:L,D-transpeptidase family protein n=1 Tax=Anaerocolumna aminovalerica TaxID=1527 RepID=UPI001597128D|nr:immunoglobulin-like domain-containing protein [Anaerocolumna aminovalerica]MDU6265771.1 DUF5011 domain-containing protein [Anaerocolumna aminovalerica]